MGFTHICGKTRGGKFTILRKTMRQRWQAKLGEVYAELRRRMHNPVPEQGAYLRSVVMGYVRYYGVPTNRASIAAFRKEVCWLWRRVLKRRSQKNRLTPVPRISTLTLMGSSHLSFSLSIGTTGSHVPHKSRDQVHATFMPDAAQAVTRLLLDLSWSPVSPPVLTSSFSFRHLISGSLALVSLNLT